MHEWWYKNDYDSSVRRLMPHVSLKERFQKLNIEVELGFDAERAAQEVSRCMNCDIQTVFHAKLCIECDACIDICPIDCLTITPNGEEAELVTRLKAPRRNPDQPLLVSEPLAADRRASWSRTRTSACTAGCAPSAARPMPGTCRNPWIEIPHAEDEARCQSATALRRA